VTVDQAAAAEAAALQIPEFEELVPNRLSRWLQVAAHEDGDILADSIQTLLLTQALAVVVQVVPAKTAGPEELLEEVKAE
jgi:hypothetical protein